MIRKNLIRSLSVLIVFSIVATFCIGFFDHNNVVASGTDYYSQFVSDSVTGYKNPAIGGLDQTGMVWTDKSVYMTGAVLGTHPSQKSVVGGIELSF